MREEEKKWNLKTFELINSEKKQLEIMREILGLRPLSSRKSNCLICGKPFEAQVIGKAQQEFICNRKHNQDY